MSNINYHNLFVAIFAAVWFVGGMYWLTTQPKQEVVVYDCSLSEISPDYPLEVREQCRKLRAQSGRF